MNRQSNQVADSSDAEHRLVSAALAQFERLKPRPVGAVSSRDSIPSFTVPGYRVLGEVHRGGQGVVYQAIQESTRRKMAIKVLKEGPFAGPADLARFDREVEVLSRLNHPHIVAIHDRGLTAGHAYYVMDYIAGRPLDAYVAGAELSVDGLLDLFLKVCDAVHVAHLRGFIHRDLKPGNILVVEAATEPRSHEATKWNSTPPSVAPWLRGFVASPAEPRILDFGLAKATHDSRLTTHDLTITGQFVGSLPWASPEQAAGESESIDIRTDVYSLGVILYQLLTGRFPYPVVGRIDDVVRHIAETSPAKPTSLARRVDPEIELILLKCLAKEPERRYQSAGELASDIRRYQANEPVAATSPSAGYRLRKFVRRNRGAVAAGAVVVLALIAATGISVSFGLSEARQRRAAEQAEGQTRERAEELEQVATFQEAQLSGIDARTMGVRLREDLLVKTRAASERAKLPREAVDERIAELEALIAGSDFTGMALEVLHESFFQPTLEAIDEQFSNQPLVKARLLQTSASTLQGLGLLDAATGPQEAALEIRRRELGDQHPDTLNSIHYAGVLLRAQGKRAEAEAHCREALEKSRRALGDDHPHTLFSINEMGVVLKDQGKLAEAEPYYREALERRRRVLGDEHPDTLKSINDMGVLFTAQGKLSEAETHYREALETHRRVLGDEHPGTPAYLLNVGASLKDQDKLEEAEPFLREALEKYRRLGGDEHPFTLVAMGNLGLLLRAQGKFLEAEGYYREALEKRRRLLGAEHPDTLKSMHNFAALLLAQGKLAEAEPYYREALEKRRRVMGEAHPDVLVSINHMGRLLLAQGKLSEAEPYCREALEKYRSVLGDEHPDTLGSIITMGRLLQAQGKPIEAIELLASAEPAVRRAITGRAGGFFTALGRARAATGDFAMAEANLNEAHAFISEDKGASAQSRTDVLTGFVELYDAWNAAEPDQGHDLKAAEYRALLAAAQSTPNPIR